MRGRERESFQCYYLMWWIPFFGILSTRIPLLSSDWNLTLEDMKGLTSCWCNPYHDGILIFLMDAKSSKDVSSVRGQTASGVGKILLAIIAVKAGG
ncbi:hypothetical protein Nepgr_027765 [Nepenthes gracilis]|uniref:Uncharacterized protein n=1 Tax=Nepenthes gracilis TaxID=150966 RepID=A0AAD3TCB2_NEPGR|nr:hypothetical protein Nepgr_027765 [Nepenthes gracilis]